MSMPCAFRAVQSFLLRSLFALACLGGLASEALAQRQMENLGRGVVAVRASETEVLVSWRLLGYDPENIGFNLYRATGGGEAQKLNADPLLGGTNFTDATADPAQDQTYHVRPVLQGVELAASEAYTLRADTAVEPLIRMPLRSGGPVKFVWVGDLDGDGEYDFVLDRQTAPQKLEAYRRDGTFLWEVDMGPNSLNQNNIEGGSTTLNVGHNDGVTVYDFDGDGRAEVAVRIANGVRFGDGTLFTNANDNLQFIAFLDGETGALRATAPVPTDYLSDGPMYARFGVGYLNGVTPSLIAYMKNRIGSGDFNLVFAAYEFDGTNATMQWKWLRGEAGEAGLPDGHNTRIIDLDGDGLDEVLEIGFALNPDGTLRYNLGSLGIVHGDRFHIAKIDPSRPGLQGFGVQQNNPSGLLDYYYDATEGTMIWEHYGSISDVGRAMVGDIDPRFPGMEVWSFHGLWNGPNNELTEPNTALRPWPQHGLWWDGDLLMELLNNGKFEKWDPENPTTTSTVPRLVTIANHGAVGVGVYPMFNGDILGDWREEVVYTNAAYDELIIFTTDQPSPHRIYTLAHNPAYRNSMTLKGYMQSHHVDYFLGHDMAPPPRPNIVPVIAGASAVPFIVSFSDDTGMAADDRITRDNQPTLAGTGPADATIIVSRLGGADDGSVVADAEGQWTFTYSSPLPDGVHYFVARVDDGQDEFSFPFQIEIDTQAPAAPVLSIVESDGADGFILRGTGDADTLVEARVDGVGLIGSAIVEADGTWSIAFPDAGLGVGVHAFRVSSLDLAGNSSEGAPRPVDLTGVIPEITGIADDTGVSDSDGITTDTTLVLSGTAAPNAEVTIVRSDVGSVGSSVADASGAWTFDDSGTSLPAGTYSFSAYSGNSPAAPAFQVTVDLAPPGVVSVGRFAPADATTNATDVTFRVTFSEAVSGVDVTDFVLTVDGGVAGSIVGMTAVDDRIYDVAVGSLAGEGTLRLDVAAAGTGIIDLAGNAIAGGFTGGQTYTRVLTGDGVWIRGTSGGLWSQNANWLDNIIAEGAGSTADFSTIDLTSDVVVQLDVPRTLTHLRFGDTGTGTPGSWLIDDNGDVSNAITLVNSGGAPTITVNALGSGATATLRATIAGQAGITKHGAGTLVLDAPATIAGGVSVASGMLRVGGQGELTSTGLTVSTSNSHFLLSGGTIDIGGGTSLSGGALVEIDSGSASFGSINGNNNSGNRVRINGGFVTAGPVTFQRSTASGMDYHTGFIVTGGTAIIDSLALGTANSNALSSIEGGSLTVLGPIVIGNQNTGGRGGHLRVTGGTFVSSDTGNGGGLVLTRRDNNVSSANFLGGVGSVERITLGFDDSVTSGSGTVNVDGGTLFLGSGGIRSRASGSFVAAVNLASGTVGAKANWSTDLDLTLPGGLIEFRAANAQGDPFDITLNGVLSGAGGFKKTGDGTLTLAGDNTFTGSIELHAGTLNVAGSLAAGGTLTIHGGRVSGGGAIAKPVVLNAGGSVAAGDAVLALDGPELVWNPDGRLAVTLGASGQSGRLALSGALLRGGEGTHAVALTLGPGFVAGQTYTIASFASTDFTAADLVATGLPEGMLAVFSVNGTSLQVTIVARPVITSELNATGRVGLPFSYTISASNQPESYSAAGLPDGLDVDVLTGLISGTPDTAGSYAVTLGATNAAGTGTAVLQLEIAEDTVDLALGDLQQAYDGSPKPVVVISDPADLDVTVTYDGQETPPTLPGTYEVVATIDEPGYQGSVSGTLEITVTALVRHAPSLNGDIDGSVQVLLPQNITLNGSAMISGDLLVPGTPTVRLNGRPTFGGTIDADGSEQPSNHMVVLNGAAVLEHVVRRVDAIEMLAVQPSPAPTGTRTVAINGSGSNATAQIGDFATVRNLILNGGANEIAVPPGSYGDFTVNGSGRLVLGVPGATEPSEYHFASLTLNGSARVDVVGPIVLTVGRTISTNGTIGNADHPEWLDLRLTSGGVTLNGNKALHGVVRAPSGTVTINGNASIHGRVVADRLVINGNGLLQDPATSE